MSTEYSTQAVLQLSPHTATLITDMTTVSAASTGFEAAAANFLADWAKLIGSGSTLSTVTSTNDVVVPLDQDGNMVFMVSWACCSSTNAPNLNVEVGDRWRGALADFDLTLPVGTTGTTGSITGRRWLIGPFESARFGKQATSTDFGVKIGAHYVRFSLTTENSTYTTGTERTGKVNIFPFRMPRVDYDT